MTKVYTMSVVYICSNVLMYIGVVKVINVLVERDRWRRYRGRGPDIRI